MTGSTDQVVTLLAVLDQVMTQGQVAQAKKIGNRDLIWAWQACTALSAEIVAQAPSFALLQLMQNIVFLSLKGAILLG
jgi:hypothetical protein